MKKKPGDALFVLLLFVACYGLGAGLEASMQSWAGTTKRSRNVLATIFGEGTRLFSNYFFVKSDIYFHRGYYPGIFDRTEAFEGEHPAEHSEAEHEEHESENFLGRPLDIIDRFSRNFYPAIHSHLGEALPGQKTDIHKDAVKEILPWLEISAELDPHKPETYIMAAYWLRSRLGLTKEAEDFLRKGWRENPRSFAILSELGRIAEQEKHDDAKARNLYEAALARWETQEAKSKDPDMLAYHQIVSRLAILEDRDGNYERSIELWEKLRPLGKGNIDKWIDSIKQKMAEKKKRQ